MSEQDIKRSLIYFEKRYVQLKLINRLISYTLFNLAAYMLLLTILVLLNVSLLLLHLLLFCSLSLLPLFLFWGLKVRAIHLSVRQIDERCQVEAYLHTSSQQHRAYMQNRVEALLQKRKGERVIPFRFSPSNLYLAAACLAMFILLQITSFTILHSFVPSLNVNNLKSTLVEIQAALQSEQRPGSEELPIAPSPPESARGDIAEGEVVEGRLYEEAGDVDFRDLLTEEGSARPPTSLGSQYQTEERKSPPEQQEVGQTLRVPVPDSESALESILRRPGEASDEASKQGDGAQSGSPTAGQTYKDSPLLDYTAVTEQIETQGNEEMSATKNITDLQRRIYLNRLFSDIGPLVSGTLDFDPSIDIIKERYLELINEHF